MTPYIMLSLEGFLSVVKLLPETKLFWFWRCVKLDDTVKYDIFIEKESGLNVGLKGKWVCFWVFYPFHVHLEDILIKWRWLTLSDAVLGRQEPLLHQTLQDRPDRRPVNQLQHKQVGLRRERRDKMSLKWDLNTRYINVLYCRNARAEGHLHNSRPLLWSVPCYVLADTLASGTRACGKFCCRLSRCTEESRWHSPETDTEKNGDDFSDNQSNQKALKIPINIMIIVIQKEEFHVKAGDEDLLALMQAS